MLERFIGAYLFQPAALDYSGDTCGNGCAYCFANINKPFRKGNLTGAIKRFHKKEIRTYDDMLLKEGYPICVSNRSDPFTKQNYRDTIALFSHLAYMDNGIFIQTKCGPGMDEALHALGGKKNIAIYITITTLRDEIAKEVEPNAPLPHERLQIARDLHERGNLVIVAINPCTEAWMPKDDLEALCSELNKCGIKHICIETLDMSRSRQKVLSESRKTRIGETALADCRTGRGRVYVRECTEYLVESGFSVAKKGMPFRSTFFDDVRDRLIKTMPVYQDFVNYCFDNHSGGSIVMFAEFDKLIRANGGIFDAEIQGSAIRDYLLRAGFVSWKANQRVPTHRDLLRIVWNDNRHKISIQKHCLFRATDGKDAEGNIILWFDGRAHLERKKEVMRL
jgi:DNA repair photolyase